MPPECAAVRVTIAASTGKESPQRATHTARKFRSAARNRGASEHRRGLAASGTLVAMDRLRRFAASGNEAMESVLGIHEAALSYRARRMDVLAANLANADTPRYLARDLTFSAALDERMSSARRLAVTDARHIQTDPLASREALQYRVPHQPSLDGNTVEADLELARYAENAVSYQATLLFASGKISQMRTALTGSR
jgi:flagellar basal-body rod protein FlgB